MYKVYKHFTLILLHNVKFSDRQHILGASEVSANLYCNSHTSVLGRLRDYLRLHMKRSVLPHLSNAQNAAEHFGKFLEANFFVTNGDRSNFVAEVFSS